MLSVFLKLHLAVFIAGFTGLFGRLVSLDAFWIVFFRMLLGGVILAGYLILFRKLKWLGVKGTLSSMIAGAILCAHLILFYLAIKLSNVSIGVVCVSTIGFFVALIEPFVVKTRFSFTDVAYSLLAIIGVLIIFGFDARYRLGIAVGIVCAIFSAIYSIYNKRIALKYENYSLISWELLGGTVFMAMLLPFYYVVEGQWSLYFSLSDAFYLLLAGVICTAGLYLLQLQVLQKLSAFTVMLSYNLEPVYSIILAMILFDEASELNISFYAGILVIIISVALKTTKSIHVASKENNI
ncbi:Threonine/homoserine efflux transporter RhtA [Succinivibrio dextrinosolvens]|uniref:DMT family transporter n=1 Tax=Succinivibrio dextrinosolvens TaxID=83771 RepID=UPI0008E0E454|nr:DMT family transporter [Succinivibrio dextrinosolvens]SFS91382.1 Threonine/homoserine efflux transporter RhtA [Succinivibrio dextrinosolvens]